MVDGAVLVKSGVWFLVRAFFILSSADIVIKIPVLKNNIENISLLANINDGAKLGLGLIAYSKIEYEVSVTPTFCECEYTANMYKALLLYFHNANCWQPFAAPYCCMHTN